MLQRRPTELGPSPLDTIDRGEACARYKPREAAEQEVTVPDIIESCDSECRVHGMKDRPTPETGRAGRAERLLGSARDSSVTAVLLAASMAFGVMLSAPTAVRGDTTYSGHSSDTDSLSANDLLQSSEFSAVRALWADDSALADQIDYQLTYRAQADFLAVSRQDLADLLTARPHNGAHENMGLYMWEHEYEELQRRMELGDRMEDVVHSITGVLPPSEEGAEEGSYGPLFAGIWQDQMDGGRIVVAVTDVEALDTRVIARVLGSEADFKVIEQRYSYDQTNDLRDQLVSAIRREGIDASVLITSTSAGRQIEVQTSQPSGVVAALGDIVPLDAYIVTEGPTFGELGNPQDLHTWSALQPGLAVAVGTGSGSNGKKCTWGFNGHTATYNYVVLAAHCAPSAYYNYSNWVVGDGKFEIGQSYSTRVPWPRIITTGDTFVVSVHNNTYDVLRAETPYADDNCYHGSGSGSGTHCQWPMASRASHNSWEINSDQTCASLGSSNTYRCGFILEENFEGGRMVRAAIQNIPGDSGSGAKWEYTIDGVIVQGSGSQVLFNTAFDVKTQLSFDFNCAAPGPHYLSAGSWGSCPVVDR